VRGPRWIRESFASRANFREFDQICNGHLSSTGGGGGGGGGGSGSDVDIFGNTEYTLRSF